MEELSIISSLTDSLKKIPGIGTKSASRIAYEFLKMDKKKVLDLISSLNDICSNIETCPKCGCYLENHVCPICDDENRDQSILVIVSSYKDIFAFERMHFNGLYHIIDGVISPSKGITPSDLHLDKLLNRIKEKNFNEVILATSSTIEGETTAQYIATMLSSLNVKVSRLGYGLPMGAVLDYTDELTLSKAFINRTNLKK